MNRPMVWVAAGFLAGIVAADQTGGSVVAVAAGTLLVGAWMALQYQTRWRGPAGIFLAFAGAGALYFAAFHSGPAWDGVCRLALEREARALVRLSGVVRKADLHLPEQDYLQFVLTVDRAEVAGDVYDVAGRVLVRWREPAGPIHPGERVEVTGRIETVLSRVNPGVYGAEAAYRQQGIHSALETYGDSAVRPLAPAPWYSPGHWASRLRTTLAHRLAESVPAESLPFVLTVWLGDRQRLDNTTYGRFLESGTAHILAVSGVHTGIVALSMLAVLGVTIRSRRRRNALLIVLVFLFALMAGARVSSLRAAFMVSLYLVAEMMDREPDSPTALSIAALVFALADPDLVFNAGFQLSFLSVASLLMFSSAFADRSDYLGTPWGRGVTATGAVQILPLPAAVTHFSVLPSLGPIFNLAVVPLLTVVLWLCFLTSVLGLVWPPLGMLFGHALHPVVALIHGLASFGSKAPGGHAYVTAPTVYALLTYYAAAAFLYAGISGYLGRRSALACCGACLFLAVAMWSPLRLAPSVTFLDVGHGDATVVVSPGGTRMLVDGGDAGEFVDRGRRTVAPFLWRNHIGALDAVVVTHGDRDHVGGLRYVIEHVPVGAVYLGRGTPRSDALERFLTRCGTKGIPIVGVAPGDSIPMAGAACRVLHPPSSWRDRSNENNASLVLDVEWPGMAVLLPGDIEAEAERRLLSLDVQAHVLKIPHHGSATSSTTAFIDAVDPAVAVASTGDRPGGSVFRAAVAERYRDHGTPVYRTDQYGGIRLRAEESGLMVESARREAGFPVRPSGTAR